MFAVFTRRTSTCLAGTVLALVLSPTCVSAANALADKDSAKIKTAADLPLNRRAPDESPAARNARTLPGNTWASILRLPKIWGGSWGGDEAGLARRIVLQNIEYPPLKPTWLAQSKAEVAKIIAGKTEFPEASCRPSGMPRLIYYAGGITFMEEPGLIALFTNEPRQIFMDGRMHPKDLTDPDALAQLSTKGHSIGRWEGKTLIIDTVGIDPQTPIYYGVPNGGGMHIVERYRLTAPDTLELRMTVDAPEVLEHPWEYRETYRRRPQAMIIGDECDPALVREKVDAQGNLKVDIAPPP